MIARESLSIAVPDLPTFISVDEALSRILHTISALPATKVELAAARGLVAASDVRSPFDVPPLDNSAYDGYALRAADVAEAAAEQPVALQVVDEIPAAKISQVRIEPGTAARIMTGAPIPAGADAVVPFEATDRADWGKLGASPRGTATSDRAEVRVLEPASRGANVRPAGGDVRAGDTVLPAGRVVQAAMIGVLGSIGVTQVPVHPRATVAIVPTGDEIVEVGDEAAPGQIRNSNAWALEAQSHRHGAVPRRLPIARDTLEALRAALSEAAGADLIVTIGGVSMGDYDLVKNLLGSDGEMDFWQINMRPGRPLAFGRWDGTPLIGLPGNPVSSMVCFELFVRPALLKLMGHTRLESPGVRALAGERLASAAGKRTFLRVQVRRGRDGLVCRLAGDQQSFRLTSLIEGNGLAVVPEGAVIEPGEEVRVLALDERELLLV